MAVVAHLRELVDGFSELTAQHLRLLRAELKEDARFVGARVGLIAALAPLILVGYGFVCVALALWLRRYVEVDVAFLLVGLVNLLGGLGGIAIAARQLGGRQMLDETQAQLAMTRALVSPGPEVEK